MFVTGLSELPDSLILEILSLLQVKDFVRTTILSKRWKDLWTTVSVTSLDFGYANRGFVYGALKKWKGNKIQKYKIIFWEDCPPTITKDILDSWLLLPIEKQVEDLFIHLGPHADSDYCATQRLYSCSSITKFFISCCNLKIDKNVNVQWNQLKSLAIHRIDYLSEDALNKILSGSPLLEELVLNLLEISENLNIRSTSLKTLHIGRYDSCLVGEVVEAVLRIQAPNLSTLEILAFFYGGNCLLDVPSLTNAILHFYTRKNHGFFGQFSLFEMFNHVFRSICHVEKVTLSALSTEFLVSLKKKDMAVPFSSAKFLNVFLSKADEMFYVLEMFPKLVMLKVYLFQDLDCALLDEEIHAAMVDACKSSAHKKTLPVASLFQLKTVEITWSACDTSIIPMMEILLENAHVLEEVVLLLRQCFTSPETFTFIVEKVLSMPRSSSTAQVVVSKV